MGNDVQQDRPLPILVLGVWCVASGVNASMPLPAAAHLLMNDFYNELGIKR